jgi:hypothetical protein
MMNPYTIGRKDIYSENFEFLSQGVKTFQMKVVYTYLGIEPFTQKHLYNLGFGVIYFDSETGLEDIDDKIITNNGDKDKILSTVALTAISFFDEHPNSVLFFQGSSPSRTRTYQMGIGQNIEMLKNNFVVRGYVENKDLPEVFQRNKNYEAFLIEQK